MERIKNTQPVGNLKISQDVIATIARVATLEVPGVNSLAEATVRIGWLFSRGIIKKAVSVDVGDDFAEIDVSVNLDFGAKITETCTAIQSGVKDNVQTMTGMAVEKVNVFVAGIVFPGNEG